MYTKQEFKEQFAKVDTDELIANALRPLTEEAMQATRELLQERGIEGHALELKVDDVRRDLIGRGGVTNQCDCCGCNTGFLPLRLGQQKFCSERCREESVLAARSVNLAPDLVYEHALAIKFGECPKCSEPGRIVEMRAAFHVLSLLWFHRYSESMELCCRSCGQKANAWAAVGCMTLGWWSIPGLFSTPYTIVKNIAAMLRADKHAEPSAALFYRAQLELARLMPEFNGSQWPV